MAMSKQQQGDPAGFLDLVGPDLSACVFARLADPADLARAATVYRPWRRFAFFQIGHPIYSSKMVRFRMGHCKLPRRSETFITDDNDNQAVIADENYIWTYTSPEFLMLQENKLQTFKLPRPVLCIGGVVKIELLGRVQKQATDDRYYICVCHAQVVGRSLSPVFMVNINDSAGYAILKHLPEAKNLPAEEVMQDSASDSQEWKDALASYREMRHLATLMNVLHEGPAHPAQDPQGDAPHFPHGEALLQEIQAMQGDANLMQQLQVDAQLLYLLQDGVLQLQDDVLQDEDGLQAMEEDDADGGGVSDNDPFA